MNATTGEILANEAVNVDPDAADVGRASGSTDAADVAEEMRRCGAMLQ